MPDLSDRIVSEVKQSPCLATMADDTTDITTLQQHITFIRYVNARGGQLTAFLDSHQNDAHGASAINLFRLWNEVAIDYNLDVSKHAAIACDGAIAMIAAEISCLKIDCTQSDYFHSALLSASLSAGLH